MQQQQQQYSITITFSEGEKWIGNIEKIFFRFRGAEMNNPFYENEISSTGSVVYSLKVCFVYCRSYWCRKYPITNTGDMLGSRTWAILSQIEQNLGIL